MLRLTVRMYAESRLLFHHAFVSPDCLVCLYRCNDGDRKVRAVNSGMYLVMTAFANSGHSSPGKSTEWRGGFRPGADAEYVVRQHHPRLTRFRNPLAQHDYQSDGYSHTWTVLPPPTHPSKARTLRETENPHVGGSTKRGQFTISMGHRILRALLPRLRANPSSPGKSGSGGRP